MTSTSFDFAYPWWLESGHLVVALVAIVILLAGWRLGLNRWFVRLVGVVAVWASCAALAIAAVGINRAPELPTQQFFTAGTGTVIDLGAGTGRSSVMVLRGRPQATLVAVDLFGDSFEHHFGPAASARDLLSTNLRAAGVEARATVQTADVTALPFPAASFDAAVSAYVFEHLGSSGARVALAEAHRVVKSGGDFLLILVANDWRTKLAFGPMLAHGGVRGEAWWREAATEAGFRVAEVGSAPATLYLLLRRS